MTRPKGTRTKTEARIIEALKRAVDGTPPKAQALALLAECDSKIPLRRIVAKGHLLTVLRMDPRIMAACRGAPDPDRLNPEQAAVLLGVKRAWLVRWARHPVNARIAGVERVNARVLTFDRERTLDLAMQARLSAMSRHGRNPVEIVAALIEVTASADPRAALVKLLARLRAAEVATPPRK